MLGHLLGTLLLVSIVAYLSGRKRTPRYKSRAFLYASIAFTLFAGQEVFKQVRAADDDERTRLAAQQLVAAFEGEGAKDAVSTSPSVTQVVTPAAQSPEQSRSQLAQSNERLTSVEFIDAATAIFVDQAKRQNKRDAELEKALGKLSMDEVLIPEALTSEHPIAKGRKTIAQFRDLVIWEKQQYESDVANMESSLRQLNADEHTRKTFWIGYERQQSAKAADTKAYFSSGLTLADACEMMLNFMGAVSRAKGVAIRDGGLMFRELGDLDKYSEIQSRVEAAAKDLEDSAARLEARRQEGLDKLKARAR